MTEQATIATDGKADRFRRRRRCADPARAGGRPPRRQRAAGQRRGGLPPHGGGARRPPAPAARRRDRPALGLDPVAVPGVQLAAAVRGRPARRRLVPHAAQAAPARRRAAADIALRATSATPTRRSRPTRSSPGSSATARSRAHVPLPGLAADAAGADQRLRRPRVPGRASSRSTRRACCAELDAILARRPARPARASSGTRASSSRCSRASRRRGSARCAAGVARAPAAAQPPRARPASSSASTSATATRRTATSPCPRDTRKLVEVANALSASLGRPLELDPHAGAGRARDDEYFAPLRDAAAAAARPSSTSACCTSRTARRRAPADRAPRSGSCTASASPPTAAGGAAARPRVDELLALHRATCAPAADAPARRATRRSPGRTGFDRVPDEEWTHAPLERVRRSPTTTSTSTAGTRTSTRPSSSSPRTCSDGDILIDYSGGTGILLDRLRLRIFDRAVGDDRSSTRRRSSCASRTRSTSDDPRVAAAAAALHQGREAAAERSTRCSARDAAARRRRDRRRQRDPPLPGPRRGRAARGCGRCGPAGACSSTPATCATRARSRASGSSTRRSGSSTTSPRALVRSDPRYAQYRAVLDDDERMRAHPAHRDRVFLHAAPARATTPTRWRATG